MMSCHVRLFVCLFMLSAATGLVYPTTARAQVLGTTTQTSYSPLTTSINYTTFVTTNGQFDQRNGGSFGPFDSACGIVVGKPTTSGNVVTRGVYVLDAGNGNPNTVALDVFTKTDTITTSSGGQITDAEQIVLTQQVPLSLTSQAGAVCYLAANDTSVFVSTSANSAAIMVNKTTFSATTITPSISYTNNSAVSAITASDSGYVYATFGVGPTSGYMEYDDQSNYLAEGVNFNFTILANTVNGTTF